MARITKLSDLETRKRALVAESDRCRLALKADLDNLGQYSADFFRKVDRVRSFTPWLLTGVVPLALPLLRLLKKRQPEKPPGSPLKGKLAAVMLGFKLYRQYAPIVRSALSRLRARKESGVSRPG